MIDVTVQSLGGTQVSVTLDGTSNFGVLHECAIAGLATHGISAAKRCMEFCTEPTSKRARVSKACWAVIHAGKCVQDMNIPLEEIGILSGSEIQLVWSPPSIICSCCADGSLQIFDENGEPIGAPIVTEHPITSVTTYNGPDCVVVVTGHTDAAVRQWDPLTGEQVGKVLEWSHCHFPVDSGTYEDECEGLDEPWSEWFPVSSVTTYAGESGTVIIASYLDDAPEHDDHDYNWFKTLRQWDAATGKPIPYVGEKDEDEDWFSITSIAAYQKDSKTCLATVFSTGDGGRLYLLDVETEAMVDDFKFDDSALAHKAQVVTTYVSDNGPIIVAGLGNSVGRWNGDTGSAVGSPLTGHETEVTAIASYKHSTGKFVIVSGSMDGIVRQWDAESGAQLSEPLTGHSGQITGIATYEARDGVVIVTASEDGEVRRWASDKAAIGSPIKHTSSVSAIAAFRAAP